MLRKQQRIQLKKLLASWKESLSTDQVTSTKYVKSEMAKSNASKKDEASPAGESRQQVKCKAVDALKPKELKKDATQWTTLALKTPFEFTMKNQISS